MNNNFRLVAFLLLSTELFAQKKELNTAVFFETDQSTLTAEAQKTLDDLVPVLLQAPDYQVDIQAFTDDRGTQSYNLQLAAARAASVQNYLATKGLIADKTAVKNWGEGKAAGSTDLGRQKSRRVDVAINAFFFKDFQTLRDRLSANTEQVLKFRPDESRTITATKGTQIAVPAHAFVFEDGTMPKGEIEVRIQEAYEPSDFLLHNLTTMSDGRILQTGGMVCIKARSDGRELQLAEGTSLTVSLPNGGNFDPDMELFYAQPTTNGAMNWASTGQRFSRRSSIGRVTISIDPLLGKRIAALNMPDYTKPTLPVFKDRMLPEPKMPVAPHKPRAPQKPVWEAVQKSFAGGGETSRLSRKEVKKAQQYFAEHLARYERDSANYVHLYERYQRNLEGYEKAKLNYSNVHRDWENELQSRLKAIAIYKRAMKLHFYSKALANVLKMKAKTITRYETYSNLYSGVEYTIARQVEWMQAEGKSVEARKAARELSIVYANIIGTNIIDNYAGYEAAVAQANAELPGESYTVTTEQMLKSTGLEAISDSLQAAIRAKELLASPKSLEQLNGMADGYFAAVTQLGWINCDRFYNSPAQLMEVVVKESEEAALYAVCKELNAMLPFYKNDNGTYSAPGLPKGMRITVVAIKIKDGMTQFSRFNLKVGELAPTMTYQSIPLRDLKTELKKLNS